MKFMDTILPMRNSIVGFASLSERLHQQPATLARTLRLCWSNLCRPLSKLRQKETWLRSARRTNSRGSAPDTAPQSPIRLLKNQVGGDDMNPTHHSYCQISACHPFSGLRDTPGKARVILNGKWRDFYGETDGMSRLWVSASIFSSSLLRPSSLHD